MKNRYLIVGLALGCLSNVVGPELGSSQVSHQPGHGQATPPSVPDNPALSPETRKLLVEEMQLIDRAMGGLLSAIASGRWKVAGEIATKIEGSFVLSQKLNDQQIHELHESLPAQFLEMDVGFHETAGKLARAAQTGDAELSVFYYSRLLEGCVTCHASFAPKRFPGLGPSDSGEHDHH